ncbi:MAG: hypothetical protein ABI811_04530 [Acidobacteriota bacterium]
MRSRSASRRAILKSILGWLAFRRVSSAQPLVSPPADDGVRAILLGLQRSKVFQRRYRVSCTASALGIPFFQRSDVGGGYASVELGSFGDTQATALQFAGGSLPDRAAGLNRFGVFREALVERSAADHEVAFAGFITSSKEEGLREARKNLKQTGDGAPVMVAWGGARTGRIWFHARNVDVPASSNWKQADDLLSGLLREFSSGQPSTAASANASTFLSVMRRAALSTVPSSRFPFLHNGKPYELRTKWHSTGVMDGEIRNDKGAKTTEFRTVYEAGDRSGLPLRIEYYARSYLRLTFETDTSPQAPIPSLFPAG